MKAFKCKTCGCTRLEEVMTDVTLSTEIRDIALNKDDEDEEDEGYVELDYGIEVSTGGELAHYQCMKCGWVLPCNSREELYNYLTPKETP